MGMMPSTPLPPDIVLSSNTILPPNTIEIIYKSRGVIVDSHGCRAPSVTKMRTYSTAEQFKEADAQVQTSPKKFISEIFLVKEEDIIEIVSIKCVGSNREDTFKPPPIDSQDGINRL
jgi:hypothetical protein